MQGGYISLRKRAADFLIPWRTQTSSIKWPTKAIVAFACAAVILLAIASVSRQIMAPAPSAMFSMDRNTRLEGEPPGYALWSYGPDGTPATVPPASESAARGEKDASGVPEPSIEQAASSYAGRGLAGGRLSESAVKQEKSNEAIAEFFNGTHVRIRSGGEEALTLGQKKREVDKIALGVMQPEKPKAPKPQLVYPEAVRRYDADLARHAKPAETEVGGDDAYRSSLQLGKKAAEDFKREKQEAAAAGKLELRKEAANERDLYEAPADSLEVGGIGGRSPRRAVASLAPKAQPETSLTPQESSARDLPRSPHAKAAMKLLDAENDMEAAKELRTSGEVVVRSSMDEARAKTVDERKDERLSESLKARGVPVDVVQPVKPSPTEESLPSAARFRLMPVNPYVMTKADRFSTFALDVDTASYALARKFIRSGYLPPPGAVRMEEFINAFDYNYPRQTGQVFAVCAEAMPSPFGRGLTLLKIGVRGKVLGREGRKPAHLVFVVDASGSMARSDRMPLVQHALGLLAEQLGSRDRVSLVAFGTEARLALEAADAASQRKEILAAVKAIECGGSTNLLEGVKLGYSIAQRSFRAGQINRVILCSDGVANVGITDAEAMLAEVESFRRQGITFTSVGLGMGAYNDELLEKLANKGDGNYVFVDSPEEAERVFVREMAATLETIAKDAKIQVEFNPARVRRYRLIGYENRDIADEDFRNDAIDAGEVGSGQSATALYELELEGSAPGESEMDLGTVYVRYRNVETEKVEEVSRRLESALVEKQTPKSNPRFFLAAAVAEFAEILRGSEHAADGSLGEVQRIVGEVAAELPLDQQVRELLYLVNGAQGLPRAR